MSCHSEEQSDEESMECLELRSICALCEVNLHAAERGKCDPDFRSGTGSELTAPAPGRDPISCFQSGGTPLAFVSQPCNQPYEVCSRAIGSSPLEAHSSVNAHHHSFLRQIGTSPFRKRRTVGEPAVHLQVSDHREPIYLVRIKESRLKQLNCRMR